MPEEPHAQIATVARDNHETLSHTAVRLIRSGLGLNRGARVCTDPVSGRLLLDVPRPITPEDVRAMEDEE
ncbi:MAG: hypothetical protein LBK95_17995 [Bifidobacteriaceae bacterium]|jgi:hypothetical protein|nr:hypothetical protein [Bifidobacteriaceae bacterium]